MSISIGYSKLSPCNLLSAVLGHPIQLDEEAVASLSPSDSGATQRTFESTAVDQFLRASVVTRIHSLVKAGEQVRAVAVHSLAAMLDAPISHRNLQEVASSLPLTDMEAKILLSPNVPQAVSLGVAVAKLQSLVPMAVAGFALSLEATGVSPAFLTEDCYPVGYRGLKSTLTDLESLLENSKLGKGADPATEFLEFPISLGLLRDTLEAVGKVVEAETNENVKGTTAVVSGKPLEIQKKAVLEIVAGLVELAKGRLGRLQDSFAGESASNDLHSTVDLWGSMCAMEVALSVGKIHAKEASLNQDISEGKARKQLSCGKGTRQLLTQLTSDTLLEDLTQGRHTAFIETLLQAKNEERRVPKIPKGMRDYGPAEMAIRSHVFECIRKVFKQHCAGELDTPVMELKETLQGKYGEEGNKLIYELADQGGEILALRYDLTVPLARYVAMNRITKLKRFHIGKVYRRDQPQVKKGRYREFYQCDFDVVGPGALMAQEGECLKIVSEILGELKIPYVMKVNHRKLLDACLEIAGCPAAKFRTVSSTIDKLDKEPWDKIREELISDKGIPPATADCIGEFVKIHGPVASTTTLLLADPRIQQHPSAPAVLQEMQALTSFLTCFSIENEVEFDLSLARGLDYYTGLVYEAVLTDNEMGIGSIGGGGRYDDLIQKLNGAKTKTPAVGVSLGIERLFAIVEKRADLASTTVKNSVLVAQAGKSGKYQLFAERWRVCCLLWAQQIPCQTSYKEKSDPDGEARRADEEKVQWVVWVGETELDQGVVRLKNMREHSEETVKVEELASFIRNHSG